MAAAALIATGLLIWLPLLATLGLGFFRYDALNPPQWVGWAHLARLLDDPLFLTAAKNSAWLVLFAVPLRLALAVVLEICLKLDNQTQRKSQKNMLMLPLKLTSLIHWP